MVCTELLMFVFFGFGPTSCSHLRFLEFHHVDLLMTWADAQSYCRDKYTDLVSIESIDDIKRINSLNLKTSWSWIGLSDDQKSWRGSMGKDENSWRWSATGETSGNGYEKWEAHQPNNYLGNQGCVLLTKSGKWNDVDCSRKIPFVCYNETNPPGQKTYTLVSSQMTWEDARTYCREHHTDLAMIENDQDTAEVMSAMPVTSPVSFWFGLYRVPWTWSDSSSSSFRNWRPGEPNNYGTGQYCAAEGSDRGWADMNCISKRQLWCYKEMPVKMTMVRLKTLTFVDLSDSATNNQILQQLVQRFSISWGNLTVRWKFQPRKQQQEADG